MQINGKEINIEDINIDIKMHPRRENGLMLSDDQINILKKYNIDYLKYNDIKSLIYEIEEILSIEYYEDLDYLSSELAEFNYYNYTNK